MSTVDERVRELLRTDAEDLAPGAATRVLDAVTSARPRRRRRWVPAAAGAALAVAAVVVGALVLAPSPGDRGAGPDRTGDVVAPPGSRLVGLGRVVVAVPQGWGTQEVDCLGRPERDTVYALDDGGMACSGPGDPTPPSDDDRLSWVQVVDATGPNSTRMLDGLRPDGEVDGALVVADESGCAGDAMCDLTVGVPSESVAFVIHAPRAVARGIRDSLRLLPEGWTTVPFVPQPAYDDANALMKAAGLEARSEPAPADAVPPEAVPEGYLYSEPAAGTPVRRGEAVVLRVVPGSLDALGDDEYPDADDIQGEWTMVLSGLGPDGQGDIDPQRDLEMSMTVDGDRFTADLGCTSVTGRFGLVNQAWTSSDVTTAPGSCSSEPPPVAELISSAKHATRHADQWYLHGSNYGIIVSFTRVVGG